MSALGFAGVEVELGGRVVLRGLDLELRPGELLGLAGPNGAGKTTLLRAATGVVPVRSGAIHVHGQPLASFPRRALARVLALVPQETSVPFPFTVGEIALMGRAPHLGLLGFERALDRTVARQALEQLGIAHLENRSVLEVSGGERQLAAVARALAQQPQVLLLDEPTAHLDLRRRLALLSLTRAWVAEGRSALVVSHDLALAARHFDRLALLSDGRIAAVGAPEQVLVPELLRGIFGVEAQVLRDADGRPVVVPMGVAPLGSAAAPRREEEHGR